jgi:hypothetical protein
MSLAKIDTFPIVVDILDDNHSTVDGLCTLLQKILPEAVIAHQVGLHIPPDIVFYDVKYVSRIGSAALEVYRSQGATLVAIAEFVDDAIPSHIRKLMPPLLAQPITTEGLMMIMEPLRNQLALKWLQRGMEGFNRGAAQPREDEQQFSLVFPTARGEEEWDGQEIILFESKRDESMLYSCSLESRPSGIVFMRLGAIESYVATTPHKDAFLRVHKSSFVHLRHVQAALPRDGKSLGKDLELHLTGGRTCICSRTNNTTFLQAMTGFVEREGGSWKKEGGLWKRG